MRVQRAEAKQNNNKRRADKKARRQERNNAATIAETTKTVENADQPKKARTRTGTWPQEEIALSLDCRRLVADIQASIEELKNKKTDLTEMKARLNTMTRSRIERNGVNKENVPPNDDCDIIIPSLPSETILHYTIAGRAGQVPIKDDGIIFVADLVSSLPPLPSEYDNDRSNRIRAKRKINTSNYGCSQC